MRQVLLLFCFGAYISQAQITIKRHHIMKAGTMVLVVRDTLSKGIAIAEAGASMTWDYSMLGGDIYDTMRFGAPGWYDGADNYPASNLAFKNSSKGAVTFLELKDDALFELGKSEKYNDTLRLYGEKQQMLTLPATYNSSFSALSSKRQAPQFLGMDFDDTAGPMPYVDSIRLTVNVKTAGNCDGYGVLTTPSGSYQSIKQTIMTTLSIDMEFLFNGAWAPPTQEMSEFMGLDNLPTDTTYRHVWWDTTGYPLLQYTFKRGEDPKNFEWVSESPRQSSLSTQLIADAELYPNPATDQLFLKGVLSASSIRISDLTGKILSTEAYTTGSAISIAHLATGVYCLQICNAEGEIITTKKFVKY